mmetsp:Transcript_38298/g.120586  ORF Transcript_38298/g.120586 Transcript_38298/m.120586 type:complete len:232 (-) Transcript_38298:145-840(-)
MSRRRSWRSDGLKHGSDAVFSRKDVLRGGWLMHDGRLVDFGSRHYWKLEGDFRRICRVLKLIASSHLHGEGLLLETVSLYSPQICHLVVPTFLCLLILILPIKDSQPCKPLHPVALCGEHAAVIKHRSLEHPDRTGRPRGRRLLLRRLYPPPPCALHVCTDDRALERIAEIKGLGLVIRMRRSLGAGRQPLHAVGQVVGGFAVPRRGVVAEDSSHGLCDVHVHLHRRREHV